MRCYQEYILAGVLDCTLSLPVVAQLRRGIVARAKGKVLELGFGTGLNLPHYRADQVQVTGLDPLAALPKRVRRRAEQSGVALQCVRGVAEQLPFDDATFDSLVCTFTLCSVRDPAAALREASRVLRPGGEFLFLEHGRSDSPWVARWQDLLTPCQRLLAGGCRLNRQPFHLLQAAGFTLAECHHGRMACVPAAWGTVFHGVAVMPSAPAQTAAIAATAAESHHAQRSAPLGES